MREALILTVMGMGVVYVVLALIYGAIVLLGMMDRVWPQTEAAAVPATPAVAAAAGISEEEKAAITGALVQHLNRSPETFSVRIRNE